jgi:hypothetical protein
MTCAVCGAPADRARAHCAVCGYAVEPEDSAKRWDRAAEADAYEDVSHALDVEEPLLGVTRGRIAGTWRRPLSFQPQALLSPYVNLGITADKLVLQPIHPSSGRAMSDKGTPIPLSDVVAMTITDADPLEAGRTSRLAIQVQSGESFRLRAPGRFAESAKQLVEVWKSLTDGQRAPMDIELRCVHCGRGLDRPHRFCPYCGRETAANGEQP